MRFPLVAALCAMALVGPVPAWAQTEITGVSPSSRKALDLYADPHDLQPVRQAPVAEIAFPLQSPKRDNGFYAITLAGQPFWVRSMHVVTKKGNSAGCSPGMRVLGPTNSTPAASEAGCGTR